MGLFRMRLADLAGARVVVWGAGAEGAAALRLLQRWAQSQSLHVVVDEGGASTPAELEGVRVLTAGDARAHSVLENADVVLKSPGVSPYHGALRQLLAQHRHIVCTGGTQVWFAEAAAAGALGRTVAVTGSKGKSTTSSLIAALLEGCGRQVVLAGNVGRAPLDVLAAGLEAGQAFPSEQWHVLELSSFQTAEVQHSPGVGVLTALFPEHLDWHLTVPRYYADKLNLFGHGVGVSVANMANADVASLSSTLNNLRGYNLDGALHSHEGCIVDGHGGVVVAAGVSPLLGQHNLENLCGALTAIEAVGVDLARRENRDAIATTLAAFAPLNHRLQPVGTVAGRLVVDDGLSTAPEAAMAALATYADRPVGIIVGGHDRGLDYGRLALAVAQRTKPTWVVGVPQSGERIVATIADACWQTANTNVHTSSVSDFDEGVAALDASVPDGGVILLSPAAPSFGRFRDYRDRSARFRELLGLP